ncbi:hypothetical protein Tco_0227843 [Tanacetum coccineum]
MSTHEQQITNNPTSAVRNTGGRNGPQGLEEPMFDEVLREMCDKNYHQLLPLIAEKMQKEKEQKDKLDAVKARLIYGIPEAHHRTPVYSRDSGRTDPSHRGPGRGKKGACLKGWEEKSQLHPRVLIFADEIPKKRERKLKPEGVNKGKHLLIRLTDTRKAKTVKDVTGSLSQEGRSQTPTRMISISLGHVKKEILSRCGSGT